MHSNLPTGKPTSEDVEKFYVFAENIYDTVRNHLITHSKTPLST